jgi:hypothetical protein
MEEKKKKLRLKKPPRKKNYILFSDFKYLTINFNVAILPVCSVVKYSEYQNYDPYNPQQLV